MNKIWVTGDAVVDLIPDSEQTYLKCPGGAPANVAVAVSRLGGESAFSDVSARIRSGAL
jgi:fructokinase